MRPTPSPSSLHTVSFQDWLLAFIGFVFTLGGLFLLPKDFNTGITTVALFGAGFAVAVHIILRKQRLRRLSLVALKAGVAGGVPIRQSRARIAMLGMGMTCLGAVLAAFQPERNVIMLGIAWFMIAVGVVLLGGLAVGLLPNGFIQFDPSGITFAQMRGKAIVPFTAITNIVCGEFNNNQAVFIWVDQGAVAAEPPSYLPSAHKQMASSQAWFGADFVIMSSSYGIDAPVLSAALARYVADPSSRDELRSAQQLS